MKFLSYILLLDSFGITTNFYVKGYKDYRSHFGGLVTLIIYIATIVCAVIFADELWNKNNPTVSTASAVYPNPTKIYYPDNIFFMFSVNNDTTPFIDDKIYRVVGLIRSKSNGTEEMLQQNISLDICSNVFNESYKYYEAIKNINLSNFHCLSLDKEKNKGIGKKDLYLNEFWGNEGFQMLQIKVYNCLAIAENKSECASKEEIEKKLNSLIISYYSLKNYIDTNNYSNPFVRGLQETFYYISDKKYISATEYLKHVQIHSDNGLIFTKEEINPDSTIDSMVEYTEAKQEDGKIFTMSLQITNKIDYYTRSYYKIQDLGAEVGAIYGALHMIFAILFQLYNTSKLFNNIINNFFLINEDFKPLSRENRTFFNLRRKFFNDLKLNISLNGRNSFFVNNSENNYNYKNKNDKYIKTNNSLNNENNQKILVTNDKLIDIMNKSKNNFNNTKDSSLKYNSNSNFYNISKKNNISISRIITQKKKKKKKELG